LPIIEFCRELTPPAATRPQINNAELEHLFKQKVLRINVLNRIPYIRHGSTVACTTLVNADAKCREADYSGEVKELLFMSQASISPRFCTPSRKPYILIYGNPSYIYARLSMNTKSDAGFHELISVYFSDS
jgi:hypothetical protein